MKYVDHVLKKKLGPFYIGILSLYKIFFKGVKGLKKASAIVFKKYKKRDNSLYAKGS